jgi:hypothetical protein
MRVVFLNHILKDAEKALKRTGTLQFQQKKDWNTLSEGG